MRSIIPYDRAAIYLYDETTRAARIGATANHDSVTVENSFAIEEEFTAWITEHRAGRLIADAAGTPQVDGIEVHCFLGLPLIANKKLVGMAQLFSVHLNAFDEHARQLLETIAPQAAIAIANAVEAKERERRLPEQIQQLRIEIDEAKQKHQVAEITEAKHFQQLQQRIHGLRQRPRKSP